MTHGLTTAEAVMLGASGIATACCLVPSARASTFARGLAVTMLALMALHVANANTVAVYAVAGAVGAGACVLAGASWAKPSPGGSDFGTQLHRATGAIVMAAFAVHHASAGHSPAMPPASDHHHHHTMALPQQHAAALVPDPTTLLTLAVIGYVAWTVVAMSRSRNSLTLAGAGEHVAMAVAVAAMAWT